MQFGFITEKSGLDKFSQNVWSDFVDVKKRAIKYVIKIIFHVLIHSVKPNLHFPNCIVDEIVSFWNCVRDLSNKKYITSVL
jgi:hypothetical protein